MIAKKYNVSLTKFKAGTAKQVSGATYKITDGTNTRTGKTDANGNITISGLYVDKEYTLKEISSPDAYLLNEDEVKFKITVDDTGNPVVNMLSGTLRNTANITNNTFIVSEKTEQKTIQNKDGVTVWEAHISYPELQGNSEAFSKINEIISNDVHTLLSATENEIVADDINTDLDNMLPYTFDCTYSITYLDDNTISILLDYYELTGGAHGMPYRQAYTFDLNTGNQLQLKDILNLSETDITEFVKNAFKNNIEQNPDNYFTGAVETVDSEHFMYDFYIESNKIIFFTQAYLLEPYANHYQPTIVNIEELQSKLKINISTNGF